MFLSSLIKMFNNSGVSELLFVMILDGALHEHFKDNTFFSCSSAIISYPQVILMNTCLTSLSLNQYEVLVQCFLGKNSVKVQPDVPAGPLYHSCF